MKNRPTCPNLIWPQSQTSAQNRFPMSNRVCPNMPGHKLGTPRDSRGNRLTKTIILGRIKKMSESAACACMQDSGIPRDPADPAWCMHACVFGSRDPGSLVIFSIIYCSANFTTSGACFSKQDANTRICTQVTCAGIPPLQLGTAG